MNVRPATIALLGLLLLRNPAFPSENNNSDCDTGNWSVLSTRHFDLYFRPGMEDASLKAAELAERGYILVANRLAHETTAIIPVRLFPAVHKRSGSIPCICDLQGPRCQGSIDVTFHGSYAELQRSITRELTHVMLNSLASESSWHGAGITSIRIPYWLSEGMARYFSSGSDDSAVMIMGDLIGGRNSAGIPGLSGMNNGRAGDIPAAGQAFCSFIDKRFGRNIFGELVREFMDAEFPDTALQAVTGMTPDELDREWAFFLMERYKRYEIPRNVVKKASRLNAPAGILIPAASPDGKKIAALYDRNGRSDLVLFDITADRTVTPLKTLLRGNTVCGLQPSDPRDNRISWSPDGQAIVLAGLSFGRPCLLVLDSSTGRVLALLELPFTEIKDPSLSRDGKYIVFTGVAGAAENIYLYDRSNKKITRITDDDFSDRYPVLSPDGNGVIFSSNWNTRGDPAEPDFHIDQIDIKTAKRASLITGNGSSIQPDPSPDGKNLVFVSDRDGTSGIYLYNYSSKNIARLDDAPPGSSNPRWLPGTGSFIAGRYGRRGYELCMGSIEKTSIPGQESRGDHTAPRYLEPYADPHEYIFHEYNPKVNSGWLQLGSAGSLGNSYLCYFRAGLTDYLGRHRLILDANYIREPGKNNVNVSLAYNLRIERTVLGFGIFRQSNPLPVHSLDEMTDHSPQHPFGIDSMEHYGGYLSSRIRVAPSFNLSLTASAGRFENERYYAGVSHDMRMTSGTLAVIAEYNSIKKGIMVPIDGFSGHIIAEHAIDFTGNRSYTRLGIDLQQHFLICRQITLSLREAGAALVGPDRGMFRYYEGGFNSLRGYGLNSASGRNMFLFNAEFGFTPVDWRTFGMGLSNGLGNLGAVLFFDTGSAWNGMFRMIDKKTGRLEDLKMDIGAGIRMAISHLLILKLDFAWPFDNKSIKQNEMLFSAGFYF